MQKPYNWRTDYDWTDPNDEPVDETIIDETELMLPKDARGLDSLREDRNMEVATSGPSHRISELIKRFNEGTITEEEKIELEMLIEMTPTMAQGGRIGYDNGGPGEIGGDNVSDILARVKELQDEGLDLGAAMAQAMKELSQGKAQGGRIGYAYGPDDPGIVEDDLSTLEFMQDQGVPYGEQASGIDPSIRIEEVVKEFIKRKGRRPRSIEEIKEFYIQEMAGGSGGPQRVAYNPGDYDPMIVDEYEKYKGSQEEQGGPVITIDEFLMQQRAGVRAGGLPGILGV